MFKVVLWSSVAATTGAAALFVPIDPAYLRAVGLLGDDGGAPHTVARTNQTKPAYPLKIVSNGSNVESGTAIHVVSPPAGSPYQAKQNGAAKTSSRIGQLAAARPMRLIAPPAPAIVPAGPTSAAMVRNLQGELRRVGCYHGRIDGDWGPASRFAMAAFIKAANAALPTDRPDLVLLTLVRRHAGRACGNNRTTSAPTITAAAPTPQIGAQRTSAWQARITAAPAAPAAGLARPPAIQTAPSGQTQRARPSKQLVGVPRIIRADGVVATRAAAVTPSNAGATTVAASSARSRLSNQGRMSLGVVPEPEAAGPLTALPRGLFGHQRTDRPSAEPRRRIRRSPPRARRSVKRRRYYRRSRSVSWRKNAFRVDN
ncbi:MAG: hypothetical protein JXQ99_16435 [Hyphomicrobiaceae bacterium]